MCVIAAKPKGVKMPTENEIRAMWARNPDGAGVMYARKGFVHIDKGFMTLDDFLAHVDKLNRKLNLTQTAVVMHFRITTHGGTCPANCHPFPISEDIKALQALHKTATIGVAHNGIIPNKPRPGISDTMEYIATQLAPLYAMNPKFTTNPHALDLIRNAIHSKMAILDGDGRITLIGDFTNRLGILYSNTHHEQKFFTYAVPTYAHTQTHVSAKKPTRVKKKAKGKKIPLMAAELLEDGTFAHYESSGEYTDELSNLFLDEDGRVYEYAPEDGMCYPEPMIHLYRYTGSKAQFERDDADMERVAYTYADMHTRVAR